MGILGKIATCPVVGEIVTANNGDVCWTNPRQLLRSTATLLRRRRTWTCEQYIHHLAKTIDVDVTMSGTVITSQLDGCRMTPLVAEQDEAILRE